MTQYPFSLSSAHPELVEGSKPLQPTSQEPCIPIVLSLSKGKLRANGSGDV